MHLRDNIHWQCPDYHLRSICIKPATECCINVNWRLPKRQSISSTWVISAYDIFFNVGDIISNIIMTPPLKKTG